MNVPNSNPELADQIIERLNMLIEDPEIRSDVFALLNVAVPASAATVNHPTIQCGNRMPDGGPSLRLIGLLCGVCGAIQDGPRAGQGHIGAEIELSEPPGLAGFRRNVPMPTTFECSEVCRDGRCGKESCDHGALDQHKFDDVESAVERLHGPSPTGAICGCVVRRQDGRVAVK